MSHNIYFWMFMWKKVKDFSLATTGIWIDVINIQSNVNWYLGGVDLSHHFSPQSLQQRVLCSTELLSKNYAVCQRAVIKRLHISVRDELVMTCHFKLCSFIQHFRWKWLNWSLQGRSRWCKLEAECVLWVREVEGGERCWQNPQETGARWGSRMTAEVEIMKTQWLSWRGSANHSINILKTAFKYPIQHLFVFPFGALIFQISPETIPAAENTNQNYVEDGVVTTEGNADGNFKKSGCFTQTETDGEKINTNAYKQSAAFGWLMWTCSIYCTSVKYQFNWYFTPPLVLLSNYSKADEVLPK